MVGKNKEIVSQSDRKGPPSRLQVIPEIAEENIAAPVSCISVCADIKINIYLTIEVNRGVYQKQHECDKCRKMQTTIIFPFQRNKTKPHCRRFHEATYYNKSRRIFFVDRQHKKQHTYQNCTDRPEQELPYYKFSFILSHRIIVPCQKSVCLPHHRYIRKSAQSAPFHQMLLLL